MSDLAERADGLVGSWPPGGLVVGLLPDPSDPPWAGRSAIALALAAAGRRRPALILDLAPKETDLASRFRASDEPGFAELVNGEVELWEVVHRHAGGEAFYLPRGLQTPGAELARSPGAASLAERIRGQGRILLVPLDRRGAGHAASAGWVDGFVRIGDRGVSSARLSGEARAMGHLERRGGARRVEEETEEFLDEVYEDGGGQQEESRTGGRPRDRGGRPRPGQPERPEQTERTRRSGRPEATGRPSASEERPGGSTGSRLGTLSRRRRRSRRRLRTALRTAAAAAVLIAAAVTASGWLGGPGWDAFGDVAGAVAGDVGEVVTPAAGPAGPSGDSATAGDSAESLSGGGGRGG